MRSTIHHINKIIGRSGRWKSPVTVRRKKRPRIICGREGKIDHLSRRIAGKHFGTVKSGLSGSGLVLQDNGGDALSVSTNGTFAFATSITSGATLQLQGNISVGAEALTLSGTGAANATGALENVSGTNTYGGLLSILGATTICSDADTLTLSNTDTAIG